VQIAADNMYCLPVFTKKLALLRSILQEQKSSDDHRNPPQAMTSFVHR
jgi:hypothetical protein